MVKENKMNIHRQGGKMKSMIKKTTETYIFEWKKGDRYKTAEVVFKIGGQNKLEFIKCTYSMDKPFCDLNDWEFLNALSEEILVLSGVKKREINNNNNIDKAITYLNELFQYSEKNTKRFDFRDFASQLQYVLRILRGDD